MGTWFIAGAAALVALPALWSWTLHVRQQRRIETLEGRLAHLTAGLSLLTDTTEYGLRDLAGEVAGIAGGRSTPQHSPAGVQQRVVGAALRGRSVRDIARAEGLSEGEVKLHLSMNGTEGSHAAVR